MLKMQGHTHTQDKDSIGGGGDIKITVYQLLLNHKTDKETTQKKLHRCCHAACLGVLLAEEKARQ